MESAARNDRLIGSDPQGGRDAMAPTERRYTKDHEWVQIDGDVATVGITDYAAGQLGDVVFVELPAKGRTLARHATFGVVESVKAVSDLYAPVSGEVVEANAALVDEPELANSDPFGAGWMVRIRLADAAEVDDLLEAAPEGKTWYAHFYHDLGLVKL